MKHIAMADKSLLIDTVSASLLTQYAALLAKIGSGDAVTLRAIGIDGSEVEVTFVLNSGTELIAESSTSTPPEPDNQKTVAYLQERLDSYGPNAGITIDRDVDSDENQA